MCNSPRNHDARAACTTPPPVIPDRFETPDPSRMPAHARFVALHRIKSLVSDYYLRNRWAPFCIMVATLLVAIAWIWNLGGGLCATLCYGLSLFGLFLVTDRKYSKSDSRLGSGIRIGQMVMAIILLLGFCAFLFHVWISGHVATKRQMIDAARAIGDLAEFPKSASNVNITRRGSVFTQEFLFTFTADPKEIEDWIRNSPGLKDSKPDVILDGIVKNKMFGMSLGSGVVEPVWEDRPIEHKEWLPDWFRPDQIRKGRRFPVDGPGIGGPLYIDDESHTVFVDVSWS